MNTYEYAVLDALNIASTVHREHSRFQATAVQIAAVLNTDRRLNDDHGPRSKLTTQAVRNYLLRLEADRPTGPLVQRVGKQGGQVLWALSDDGVKVLIA